MRYSIAKGSAILLHIYGRFINVKWGKFDTEVLVC